MSGIFIRFIRRLIVSIQEILPKRVLSKLVQKVAESEIRIVKNTLIKLAIAYFKININEAISPNISSYKTFNHFFTRQLRDGVRPIDERQNSVCSPADGTITQFGVINSTEIMQAKNINYSLKKLTQDTDMTNRYINGNFFTIYLSPKDYHRVHIPFKAKIVSHHFVPGELYSVNKNSVDHISEIYNKNERLICEFVSKDLGYFSVIFIGAFLVSGIETVWKCHHDYEKTKGRRIDLSETQMEFEKGEELGTFKYGSTIILLFQNNKIAPLEKFHSPGNNIQVGNRITTTTDSTSV